MSAENNNGGSAALYSEIGDADTRISFRTGEIVIAAANSDTFFQRRVEFNELTPDEVFPSRDGLNLTLASVCKRIQKLDGVGGVVRILQKAIEGIEGHVNGDSDSIRTDLSIRLEQYRKLAKAERKQRKSPPLNLNS